MLLTSCVNTKVVYKNVVPDVKFPDFPEAEYITDNKNDTCTVPSSWIVQLGAFKVRYQSAKKTYDEIKDLLESEE